MAEDFVYLDHAAGTPVSPLALRAGYEVAGEFYGNSAALHASARASAELLKTLRRDIAGLLAVKPANLVFTAGATEANNLVALSLKATYPEAISACPEIDHDSLKLNAGYLLKVNPNDARLTEAAILEVPSNVCCLSLAGINNELGVIQPFAAIRRAVTELRRRRQAAGNRLPLLLHVDASQMAATHSLQPQALAAADLVTYNGAKFHAFKQSGLLYVGPGLNLRPPLAGGGQEMAWRPGGESLMLAAGLKTALEEISNLKINNAGYLKQLQADFEKRLKELGAEIVLEKSRHRSPHISVAIFKGYDNETLAFKLSNAGVYAGVGSACHSRTDLYQTSALRALGYARQDVYAALRFSFAFTTTATELAAAAERLAIILTTPEAGK